VCFGGASVSDDKPRQVDDEFTLALQSSDDVQSALHSAVELALRHIPNCAAASVTLLAERPATAASSDALADRLDERQYAAGRGPCLHAAEHGHFVVIPDIVEESRWPEFVLMAAATGIGSSLSVPLRVDKDVRGSLNLYAQPAQAFDSRSLQLAHRITDQIKSTLACSD
jgi:GAF domain-containing protein